ncbi:hypothetical protein NW762_003898 [Fusarium torreyae]|uniref:Polyamine transport protein n=1 Tax=Fusarium torreyae TaxID=1237075 RepID=A0A9W8VI35_9HYPO|nr:hypothetical protein NW762_003898 [Fusarium torreyae]
MSNGQGFLSNTTPTQTRQTADIHTFFKKPPPLKHDSTKAFRVNEIIPSSSDSAINVVNNPPQPSPSAQDTQSPAMFSTLISQTRALLPRQDSEGQAETDVGGFDHTPPPSGRPSVDMSSDEYELLDNKQESRAKQSNVSRHRPLKISSNGSIIARKDDPTPPVLSPFSESEPRLPARDVTAKDRNSNTTYATPKTSSASILPQNGIATNRNHVESLMCVDDRHVAQDVTGLIDPTDSFDATEASWDKKSGDLLGQDLGGRNKERVVPHVRGKSHCTKVRPPFNLHLVDLQRQPKGDPGRNYDKPSKIPYNDVLLDSAKGPMVFANSSSSDANTINPSLSAEPATNQSCALLDDFEEPQDTASGMSSRTRKNGSPAVYTNGLGRSKSSGSIVEFLWKGQWLKRLMSQEISSSLKLTELPPRRRSTKMSLPDGRRPSEPVLPSSEALRRLSAWSTFSNQSDHGVDGFLFKRAISDLERLLDEAFSLVLEVADHSEAAVRADYSSLPDDHRSDTSSESTELSMHSAQETIDVPPTNNEDVPGLARPECRRAATYTCFPKRPRLADVVESYSGMYQELRRRSHVGRVQHHHDSQRTSPDMSSRRSSQVNNTGPQGKLVTLEDLLNTSDLFKISAEGKGAQEHDLLHKRSAAANTSSAMRNGTGRDALPDRDIAGRKLHGEHGINLRRRSHVSLRDMQGFNLPKSHIRQPIARD